MKNEKIIKICAQITPTDQSCYDWAQNRLDNLVKPPGSLGELEEIAKKLCAITKTKSPDISKRSIIIMASDNGVVSEGIASAPQSVTLQQTINFTRGITGVAVLADLFRAKLMVVDVGINSDFSHPSIINKKIRKSTGNIAVEPALSQYDVIRAIEVGIECVKEAKNQGFKLLGAGEMGIGNTTTTSAVLCGLLGIYGDDIYKTVGRGAGLSDEGYQRKITVIKNAIAINSPAKDDPVDVLGNVGGLDLSALCGVYLGAAIYKMPIVVDGFISIVAALCAYKLCPLVKEYLFASHHSFERGYEIAAKEIGLQAPLHFNMRLGEGSGCPLMFGMMDAACAILNNMATFEEAAIDANYLDGICENNAF